MVKKRDLPPEMLSTPHAARRLGIGLTTLRRWIKAGVITGHRMGPRSIRIKTADIDALIARGTISTEAGK